MTKPLLTVDPGIFAALNLREKARIKNGLEALGVGLGDVTVCYTDGDGRVVGARLLGGDTVGETP